MENIHGCKAVKCDKCGYSFAARDDAPQGFVPQHACIPINETKCYHCGASMKEWTHRLTPGLIRLLMRFASEVRISNKNDVYFQGQISTSANDCNNFTKLRYFGLIAKVRDDEDAPVQGHWLLTRRGGAFLRGDEMVAKSVTTFRNKITHRNDEKVFVWEVQKDFSKGYFQQDFSKENFNL